MVGVGLGKEGGGGGFREERITNFVIIPPLLCLTYLIPYHHVDGAANPKKKPKNTLLRLISTWEET